VPPKSCTFVTATANKIVVALGEESAAGMVTAKITKDVITIKFYLYFFLDSRTKKLLIQ